MICALCALSVAGSAVGHLRQQTFHSPGLPAPISAVAAEVLCCVGWSLCWYGVESDGIGALLVAACFAPQTDVNVLFKLSGSKVSDKVLEETERSYEPAWQSGLTLLIQYLHFTQETLGMFGLVKFIVSWLAPCCCVCFEIQLAGSGNIVFIVCSQVSSRAELGRIVKTYRVAEQRFFRSLPF